MNNGTKLTAAATLAIAGISAIGGSYAWFQTGSGNQPALIGAGSILSAIGFVTALHHWLQSEGTGPGSSVGWALAAPMFLPGCGAFLMASLLVVAGIFCLSHPSSGRGPSIGAWASRWLRWPASASATHTPPYKTTEPAANLAP